MGRGSLNASSEGIQKALAALQRQRMTQKALAEELQIARSTVSNFFAGKAIDRSIFIDQICHFLDLDWHEIVQYPDAQNQQDRSSTSSQSDDALFQQVREHCRQKILNHHSRMRLLSGEEIGVDQLYVDVWLLNRSPRTFQISPNKFLETFDLRNDRLGLGNRIRREEGFKVADNNSKLLILGKPGSGKTTFLKHLAVDWCEGKFQPGLIAVLVELRRIQDRKWNLIEAIDQELGLGNWHQFEVLKQEIELLEQQQQKKQLKVLQQQFETLPLQYLLKQGKLLVLMDGLDEVPTIELRQTVQNQLQQTAEVYPLNRLILTCRTQIIESIPIGFTSVEVADFSEKQVQQFVQNWFMSGIKSKAEAMRQKKTFNCIINHNPALKELTVTPVLLSLMCLVMHDEGEIPTQRDWLYHKGIKLLLSKWNDAKQIDGWELGSETYRRLNIEQKEALLIEIAARKFKDPQNFVLFHQQEIVTQITSFLQLVNYREGIAVLKAIEAQHGLLIERADELWSFSQLTFQEYFTVQWLTRLPSEQLAEKIANHQWRRVVEKIVKSQQPADRLLRMIKQAIDQSIANKLKLQNLLIWLLQKSASIQATYRPVAIRAFYLDSEILRTHGHIHDCTGNFNLSHVLDRTLARHLDFRLDCEITLDLTRMVAPNLAPDLAIDLALDLAYARVITLDLPIALAFHSELVNQLKQLRATLPTLFKEDWESLRQWLQSDGIRWLKQLRQVMIEHRSLGHDWQFDDAQTQQLHCYYDANKFLVELMQIEGAVSNDVRTEIEDSLLLPWEELQRRQS